MSLTVIDYTDRRFKAAYARHRRENGAVTYAKDIARFHLPLWRAWAEKHDARVRVSTTPLMRHPYHQTARGYDLQVQYLHTWPADDPVRQARAVRENLKGQRIVFVTAYQPMETALREAGVETVYIPMRIDVQRVRKVARWKPRQERARRFAYYGNMHNPGKPELFRQVEKSLRRYESAELVHVSSSNQAECLRELNTFTHGVGVGRCALEMMALGLKVILAGSGFGGLAMDMDDWYVQESINFNGRRSTAASSVAEAVAWWDDAMVPDRELLDHGSVGKLRGWLDHELR